MLSRILETGVQSPKLVVKTLSLMLFILYIFSAYFLSRTSLVKLNDSHLNNGTSMHQYKPVSRRLPQAIIIGSRKAGTRALLKFLELNPLIRAASNEVHFFDRHFDLGLDWYREQMPLSKEQEITIEKSPAYFVTSLAPERIKSMNSTIKLILILRDPVTRLISDFSQLISNKLDQIESDEPDLKLNETYRNVFWSQAELEFERYVLRSDGSVDDQRKGIKIGTYSTYLERWRTFFPMAQIHLVDGERLIREPHEEVRKLELFLGIQPKVGPKEFIFNPKKGFFCIALNKNVSNFSKTSLTGEVNSGMKCLSKNKGRRHVHVRGVVLQKIREYYQPYNEYLFSLINQKFNWK